MSTLWYSICTRTYYTIESNKNEYSQKRKTGCEVSTDH